MFLSTNDFSIFSSYVIGLVHIRRNFVFQLGVLIQESLTLKIVLELTKYINIHRVLDKKLVKSIEKINSRKKPIRGNNFISGEYFRFASTSRV